MASVPVTTVTPPKSISPSSFSTRHIGELLSNTLSASRAQSAKPSRGTLVTGSTVGAAASETGGPVLLVWGRSSSRDTPSHPFRVPNQRQSDCGGHLHDAVACDQGWSRLQGGSAGGWYFITPVYRVTAHSCSDAKFKAWQSEHEIFSWTRLIQEKR